MLEVARPDFAVVDRSRLADSDILAAAKGFYLLRDFDENRPKQGYVMVQGSSSTNNLVSQLDKINDEGLNVRIISAISEELFNRQSDEYRQSILPASARYDLMVISTGTKRMWPVRNVGPLTEEYSLVSDWNDEWLTGGSETEVLKDARLDPNSILSAVRRFAHDHESRVEKQTKLLSGS